MVIEIPEKLEAALKHRALLNGVSADAYIRELLRSDLASLPGEDAARHPLKTGYGSLAKYGPAPSAEEIDANRADMFRNFGEDDCPVSQGFSLGIFTAYYAGLQPLGYALFYRGAQSPGRRG